MQYQQLQQLFLLCNAKADTVVVNLLLPVISILNEMRNQGFVIYIWSVNWFGTHVVLSSNSISGSLISVPRRLVVSPSLLSVPQLLTKVSTKQSYHITPLEYVPLPRPPLQDSRRM